MAPRARTIKAAAPTLICLRCGWPQMELHFDTLAGKWVCEKCFALEDEIQREAAQSDDQP